MIIFETMTSLRPFVTFSSPHSFLDVVLGLINSAAHILPCLTYDLVPAANLIGKFPTVESPHLDFRMMQQLNAVDVS